MHRPTYLIAFTSFIFAAACTTTRPWEPAAGASPAQLGAKTQKKIEKGVIEPGYTPEMVYLALGKPSLPAAGLADATKDGTWVYQDFQSNGHEFIRAGMRQHVVYDPAKRNAVVVTEPIEPAMSTSLTVHSLHVTFRDGRVVEIRRSVDS